MKVLVNVFHPNLSASTVNKAWVERLEGEPEVTVRKIYELYPDGKIDVAAEQEEVVYAQEVQVDQAILRLILGEALADEVWHGCDAVAVLYGRGDGD